MATHLFYLFCCMPIVCICFLPFTVHGEVNLLLIAVQANNACRKLHMKELGFTDDMWHPS